jgi:hypothetical protein
MRRVAHPMLEQLLEGRVRFYQRRQTVANVARRQDSVLSTKLPGAAAIVGDSDDSRNRVVGGLAGFDKTTEPFEDCWEPRPAP